jgi:hypothetical protein
MPAREILGFRWCLGGESSQEHMQDGKLTSLHFTIHRACQSMRTLNPIKDMAKGLAKKKLRISCRILYLSFGQGDQPTTAITA